MESHYDKNNSEICTGVPNLKANYEIETLTYYKAASRSSSKSWLPYPISLKYATSTQGRNLIHGFADSTGIMLWPASHLLCQYLTWNSTDRALGPHILELGCGCGIVSVTAAKLRLGKVVVCSDMDKTTLQLATENISFHKLNSEKVQEMVSHNLSKDFHYQDDDLKTAVQLVHNDVICLPYCLSWGNQKHIQQLQSFLQISSFINSDSPKRYFDTILAADIIYPNTCGPTLKLLFQTVDALLSPLHGKFIVSFVTRDNHRTPLKLISAATEAGYSFDLIPNEIFCPKDVENKLPPLMEAKLLVLTKNENAVEVNATLGSMTCRVFPGLIEQQKEAVLQAERVKEEWTPPFCECDDL